MADNLPQKISLADFTPQFELAGLKSHSSLDEWLNWEVCCGGACLLVVILIVLWMLYRWFQNRRQQQKQ